MMQNFPLSSDTSLFDALVKIGIALLSAIVGGAIFRWWDRARPFILLHGFGDAIVPNEQVTPHQDISSLTQDSWTDTEFPSAPTAFDVRKVYFEAMLIKDEYAAAEEQLPILLDEFTRASNNATAATEVLRQIMTCKGVGHALYRALVRSLIVVPQPSAVNANVIVPYEEHSANNGCYRFLWKEIVSDFGENLATNPVLKSRLESFVKTVSIVDQPTLNKVFTELQPLISRQLKLHGKIHELIKPLFDEHIRWDAKIWVANYGAAPMIIWPDAALFVRGTSSYQVPAILDTEHDDQPRIRSMQGPLVLKPGDNIIFWAKTTTSTNAIPNGHLLMAHYNAKDARARIRLHVKQRGVFLGSFRYSAWSTFEESLVLPS